MDSASLWTTLFHRPALDLLCPFLDSRMVRLALNLPAKVRYPFRRPKDLLKRALARHAPAELVGPAQARLRPADLRVAGPGGQLRPLVEPLGGHDFVDAATLVRAQERPNWFLYSLLCYDLWHKLFIDRSLPRPGHRAVPRRDERLRASRWRKAVRAGSVSDGWQIRR